MLLLLLYGLSPQRDSLDVAPVQSRRRREVATGDASSGRTFKTRLLKTLEPNKKGRLDSPLWCGRPPLLPLALWLPPLLLLLLDRLEAEERGRVDELVESDTSSVDEYIRRRRQHHSESRR